MAVAAEGVGGGNNGNRKRKAEKLGKVVGTMVVVAMSAHHMV